MRQPDPGLGCRGEDSTGQLGLIVIMLAAGLIVGVVKLANRGIARLLHLHKNKGGDGFDLLRGQVFEEPVHQHAPGPETVTSGRAVLGHSGHRPLERMAVQIAKRRQQRIDSFVAVLSAGSLRQWR